MNEFRIWGANAPRVLAMAPVPSRTFFLRALRRGAAMSMQGRVRSLEFVAATLAVRDHLRNSQPMLAPKRIVLAEHRAKTDRAALEASP